MVKGGLELFPLQCGCCFLFSFYVEGLVSCVICLGFFL